MPQLKQKIIVSSNRSNNSNANAAFGKIFIFVKRKHCMIEELLFDWQPFLEFAF